MRTQNNSKSLQNKITKQYNNTARLTKNTKTVHCIPQLTMFIHHDHTLLSNIITEY